MAGISTSIQMADRMTLVLRFITTAMNMMASSMTVAQVTIDAGYDSVCRLYDKHERRDENQVPDAAV